jgi:hypothetical protein
MKRLASYMKSKWLSELAFSLVKKPINTTRTAENSSAIIVLPIRIDKEDIAALEYSGFTLDNTSCSDNKLY